jgi:hypothetical protein
VLFNLKTPPLLTVKAELTVRFAVIFDVVSALIVTDEGFPKLDVGTGQGVEVALYII